MKKLLLFTVAIIFASCTKSADFTKIKKGMKLDDVVALVGEPKEKKDIPFINAKFYMYDHNVVVFMNEKVTRCETKTEMAASMEKSGLGNISKDIDKIDNAIKELKTKKAAN